MLIRAAYVYVGCLFALGIVLSSISLVIETSTFSTLENVVFLSGKFPFLVTLAVAAPTLALAKEKNIWRNEFRSCPKWMQIAAVLLSIAGFLGGALTIFANGDSPRSQLLFGAGFAVFAEPLALCVLYSLLWASPVSDSELLKRIVPSLIVLFVCVVFIVSSTTGAFHYF